MASNTKSSESNLFAALSYVPVFQPILAIIIFLLKREDKFVRFHSVQAIGLFLVSMAAGVALWIIGIIIAAVTLGVGLVLVIPVFMLFGLAMFALCIWLAFRAYSGEKYKLPKIGDWAESFK